MSSKLWEYFIQDDVESFRRYLANATFAGPRASGTPVAAGAISLSSKNGSPGSMMASSPNPTKPRKSSAASPGTSLPDRSGFPRGTTPLSRSDVNARDHFGRTLLHHIASSPKPTAASFANALLEIPFLDIYAQDWESGWTALHRALYAGNASIAQALMARDMRDMTDYSKLGHTSQSGSLIKIKDREGYSPFDVYGSTITLRDIKEGTSSTKWPGMMIADLNGSDAASNPGSYYGEDGDDDAGFARSVLKSRADFSADEVFTFGSNKNLNLGLGDQDDRQFPERIVLKRPDHLLKRFYREYEEEMEKLGFGDLLNTSNHDDLPTVIKSKPMKIQNVVMSKLHTAVITDDPEANLFVCGFGPGGRLGTGDESTRFNFVCIETGGLADKKVMSVALGQDHSLAITEFGEIFSWGSNKFGQLGYSLPRTSNKNDVPIQSTPRQIFNPFKKEVIIGAAASSIHSVVVSTSGLYTFGKNEGQLGLVDSDARSLEIQTTPRRVGASLFKCPIQMVSAIDRATAVLLQNHEVWVFSQYGYSKLSFPLEASSSFIRNSFMATRYDSSANRVVKLACGGNTICALASSGDVFTVHVNKSEDPSTQTSTTNPTKIRNSLATPERAWSVKKSHMAASDVDVGQDGSIIICTTSGSAWRKEKRTKNKAGAAKEYKFARIPGLSSVVAVRSNAFGAYAVAQRDCDVTREQIHINRSTLWDDLIPLSPFVTPSVDDVETILEQDARDNPVPFSPAAAIKRMILSSSDIESQILPVRSEGTIWVASSTSDARIPVHEFLLTGRSPVLRKALQDFRDSYYASVPDVLDIEYGKDGVPQIRLLGVDYLTVMNVVFFLYTDGILDVWHQAKSLPENAARYRQIRIEIMKVATHLGLPMLERAARLMVEPQRSLKTDMAHAINYPSFFNDADVVVELNGDAVRVHSQLVCQRCPFFEALFHGRSRGGWIASRRAKASDGVHVDLKHINRSTFEFVLRYLYADTEEQLFDQVQTKTLNDLIDLLLDVMYVANELMIDRLSQICQKMLGRFVSSRNVSYLLNSVAPIYVSEFKEASLEYICLNLEAMLANRYLEDLDENLLKTLDTVCHENQLACFPVSRGRNSEDYVFEKYPELVTSIEKDKQRRIDAMALQSRLSEVESYDYRSRFSANDKTNASPLARKTKPAVSMDNESSINSPLLKPKQSTNDLMFQMDDETALSPGDTVKGKAVIRGRGMEDRSYPDSPALGASLPEGESLGDGGSFDRRMSSPREALLAESPSEARATAMEQRRNMASPPGSGSAPWGSPVVLNRKKDLKDIMGEASQTRVSNLTLGMENRRESSGSFNAKLSQKERKKMQQQQMQEKLAAQQKAKATPKNPWQLPPPATQPAPVKDPLPGQSGPNPSASDPSKGPPKPAMTLRQTVAGTPPPRPKPMTAPVPAQNRSVSGNIASPSYSKPSPSGPPTSPPQTVPKASPQPVIQSIRHIPRQDPYTLSSSGGSLSLATILLQQQSEKDEIREAATAKHNLQEIQAEQEFQQWWDQESKRVQGLLGNESRQQPGGKGGRGGKASGEVGGSRKRRGNKNTGPDGASSPGHKNPARPASSTTYQKTIHVNGPPSVSGQGVVLGTNSPSAGGGKNARRGGYGNQRGKGKDRG